MANDENSCMKEIHIFPYLSRHNLSDADFFCRIVYIAVCVDCFSLKPELMLRTD